jgi:hypothetical protein
MTSTDKAKGDSIGKTDVTTKPTDWSNWRNEFANNRTSDRCFAINVYYPK